MGLPSAKGEVGEILLIMDTTQWSTPMGKELQEVLTEPYPILPQAEPYFRIRRIAPEGFVGLLREARTVVMVATFNDSTREGKLMRRFYSKDDILKSEKDPAAYMSVVRDVYARGQRVIMLYGKNPQSLMENLRKNKARIQQVIDEPELEAFKSKIFKTTEKNMQLLVKKKFGFSITLPKGYQVATDTVDFLWLRHAEVDFDNNLVVASKPYTSEAQFELANVIAWRNELAKKYLYGDPKNPNSFVLTETLIPPVGKLTKVGGQAAMEVRGLWKTNNISMGGPFVAYVFTDPQAARLYYVEGFVFAPGKDKRNYIREMEAIISSIKF